MEIAFRKAREKIGGFLLRTKKTRNFITEKGKVQFRDFNFNLDIMGITDKTLAKQIQPLPYDYTLFTMMYKQIPKVFRAVNTRANFAIQSGFQLMGEEGDVDEIESWQRKIHFDNYLIQFVKEMLNYGNVFIHPFGTGQDLELKILPVDTMRVLRKDSGEITGYAQIQNRKLIDTWEPDELIHIRWNTIGTEAYGISELNCLKKTMEKKLDAEDVIVEIIKSQYVPKVLFKCGKPEKPFSTTQISNFKGTLENRDVGSDLLVPGDVEPVIIQHNRGSGDSIMNLINHIEEQIDTGLNFPEILIAGRSDAQGSIIQMDSLERDVKTIQDVLGLAVEGSMYTRVLGKDEVPEIVWTPMNIDTELRRSRTLRQLVGDGSAPPIITSDEARKTLGLEELTDEQKKDLEDMQKKMSPSPMGGNDGFGGQVGKQQGNPAGRKKVQVPKVQKVGKSK
jgi:hypothetical protein